LPAGTAIPKLLSKKIMCKELLCIC